MPIMPDAYMPEVDAATHLPPRLTDAEALFTDQTWRPCMVLGWCRGTFGMVKPCRRPGWCTVAGGRLGSAGTCSTGCADPISASGNLDGKFSR